MRERADKYTYRRRLHRRCRSRSRSCRCCAAFCFCVCLCVDGGRCSDFWIRLCGGPQPGAAAAAAGASVVEPFHTPPATLPTTLPPMLPHSAGDNCTRHLLSPLQKWGPRKHSGHTAWTVPLGYLRNKPPPPPPPPPLPPPPFPPRSRCRTAFWYMHYRLRSFL
jgi:hypothetical protein